jgi:hypothetical protein
MVCSEVPQPLRHRVPHSKWNSLYLYDFLHGLCFNGPKQTGTALRLALFVALLKISRFIIYPVGGFNFRHEMFWTKQKQQQYYYSQG